jgi:hypothetical protein
MSNPTLLTSPNNDTGARVNAAVAVAGLVVAPEEKAALAGEEVTSTVIKRYSNALGKYGKAFVRSRREIGTKKDLIYINSRFRKPDGINPVLKLFQRSRMWACKEFCVNGLGYDFGSLSSNRMANRAIAAFQLMIGFFHFFVMLFRAR